jgi:hypothetical protein
MRGGTNGGREASEEAAATSPTAAGPAIASTTGGKTYARTPGIVFHDIGEESVREAFA